MTATLMAPTLAETVTGTFRKRRLRSILVPLGIIAYLIYAAIALDVAGLASRARLDNAAILLADFWSHKVHVTQPNAAGPLTVAIEGEAKGTFPAGTLPDWVTTADGTTRIDLGDGHLVTYGDRQATYAVPGYGTIAVALVDGKVTLDAPLPLPAWISVSDNRVSVTTDHGRFAFTRSKVETFRYFAGWELFFFTLDSPFHGKSLGDLAGMALWGERVDPARSNIGAMIHDIWTNKMWRHGDVVWALFETLLMAFLGTFMAAIIAMPLAFVAASNVMPVRAVRFGARRVFDFLRGIDALIWTILLARAFGPGPMTGALAILISDTGTFGKTFSEAVENVDEKQLEGVRATGANAAQRARFGILPQIAPVMLSQVLYMLESNTRSATVIGAIVGGGIGLMLTQAISTQKDWEEVAYYLVLIVLMVMAMDSLSGWLRRKLIKGN